MNGWTGKKRRSAGLKDERLCRSLRLLYPTEDWRERLDRIRLKRRREMALACAAVLTLYVLGIMAAPVKKELSEDNRIYRNGWEEGDRQIRLTAEIEGVKHELKVQVEPQSYTREELETLFYRMLPALEEQMAGKNGSLQKVTEPLQLEDQVKGYPFLLHYGSSNPELLGTDGSIADLPLPEEGERVWVDVTAECGGFSKTYRAGVRVMRPEYSPVERMLRTLADRIRQAESENREAESFRLPAEIDGKEVRWEEPSENGGVLPLLGLGCLPLLWIRHERELNRALEERKKKLLQAYPDYISRMTLLLGTGMTVHGAMCRIRQEEQKRADREKNYLLNELTIYCRALDAGVPEGQACLDFGKRCGLQQYRRAAALLSQNLKRGSKNLLAQLEYETHNALEDRKAQARQWGEEAGSKLLVPMMIMLIVVMILIMVPALGSFSL